jgi:hypothetical protein
MAPSRFTRLGGLGALLGGILWLATMLLIQFVGAAPVVLMPATILFVVIGFIALQARHAGRSGLLGRSGYATGLIGCVLIVLGSIAQADVALSVLGVPLGPWRFHGVAPGAVAFGIGAVLSALSAIWLNVLPRLSPVPLLIGGLGLAAAGAATLARQVLDGNSSDVMPFEALPLLGLWAIFGAGLLWLGFLMMSERTPDTSWR